MPTAAPTAAPTATPYVDPNATVVDKADVTLKTEIQGRCSDKVIADFDWSGKKGLVADSFETKVGLRPQVTVRCDESYRHKLKARGGKGSAVQVDGLIIESEWVKLNDSSWKKLEEEEEEEFSDDSSATSFLADAGVKAIEVDG